MVFYPRSHLVHFGCWRRFCSWWLGSIPWQFSGHLQENGLNELEIRNINKLFNQITNNKIKSCEIVQPNKTLNPLQNLTFIDLEATECFHSLKFKRKKPWLTLKINMARVLWRVRVHVEAFSWINFSIFKYFRASDFSELNNLSD